MGGTKTISAGLSPSADLLSSDGTVLVGDERIGHERMNTL